MIPAEHGDSDLVRQLKKMLQSPRGVSSAEYITFIHRIKDLEVCKRLAVEVLEAENNEVYINYDRIEKTLEKVKAFEKRSNI